MKRLATRQKKILLIVLMLALVATVAGAIWWKVQSKVKLLPSAKAPVGTASVTKPKARLRLIAAGDFVIHDSVNANAKQADGSYNYFSMMQDFQPVFAAADIRFCNQITLAGGSEFGLSGYPKFNAPLDLIRDMDKLGCNLINMASNHSFDKNQAAISANVAEWAKYPNLLAAAGQNRNMAEHDKVHVFEQQGVKIAFLAYTTYINRDAPVQNNFGVNEYSRALASQQIAEAKRQGADIIIASMRWGTEYSPQVNPQQTAEAQFLASQGVRLILGHGPHVLQPVDVIPGPDGKKTYVWYSLGNFLHTQIEKETLFSGLAVVDIQPGTKDIASIGYLPLYMHYEWSAADRAAERLLARHNVKMYLLDDVTPDLLASHQLKTTVEAERQYLTDTLNQRIKLPILTKTQYFGD